MKKLILAILMTFAIYNSADAVTRYVDSDCGNVSTYVPATGACTGGSASVYTTIAGAMAATADSDDIEIRGGIYFESALSFPAGVDGVAGNPITVTNYSTEDVFISGGTKINIGPDGDEKWIAGGYTNVYRFLKSTYAPNGYVLYFGEYTDGSADEFYNVRRGYARGCPDDCTPATLDEIGEWMEYGGYFYFYAGAGNDMADYNIIIQNRGSVSYCVFDFELGPPHSYVTFDDLGIIACEGPFKSALSTTNLSHNITWQNCWLKGFRGGPSRDSFTFTGNDCLIKDNFFSEIYGYFICFGEWGKTVSYQAKRNIIEGNYFEYFASAAINVEGTEDLIIRNNEFSRWARRGMYDNSDALTAGDQNAVGHTPWALRYKNLLIEKNWFHDSDPSYNPYGVSQSNWAAIVPDHDLSYCDVRHVNNEQAYGFETDALHDTGQYQVEGLTFRYNRFDDVWGRMFNQYCQAESGYYYCDHKDIKIYGNIFHPDENKTSVEVCTESATLNAACTQPGQPYTCCTGAGAGYCGTRGSTSTRGPIGFNTGQTVPANFENLYIVNNTFYGSPNEDIAFGGFYNTIDRFIIDGAFVIANNATHMVEGGTSDSSNAFVEWSDASDVSDITKMGNNVVYRENNPHVYWTGSATMWTVPEFQAQYGIDQNSVYDNPDYTNTATGDFTLQASSPCINNGDNTIGSTFQVVLHPSSQWPHRCYALRTAMGLSTSYCGANSSDTGIVLADQSLYGAGWEVGAYVYDAGGVTTTVASTTTTTIPLGGTTFYIHQNGTASWDGTSGCDSVDHAMSPAEYNANATVTAGNTYVICDGMLTNAAIVPVTTGLNLKTTGTALASIIYTSETGGNPVIDTGGTGNAPFYGTNVGYITIENMTIRDSNYAGIELSECYEFTIQNNIIGESGNANDEEGIVFNSMQSGERFGTISDNTIQYNVTYGISITGTAGTMGNGGTIEDNIFTANGSAAGIAYMSDDVIIKDNSASGHDNANFYIYGSASYPVTGAEISHNYIDGTSLATDEDALLFQYASGAIRGNIVFGDGVGYGVTLLNIPNGTTANALNNSLYNLKIGIYYGTNAATTGAGVLKNNIIHTTVTNGILVPAASTSYATLDNNVFYACPANADISWSGTSYSLANFISSIVKCTTNCAVANSSPFTDPTSPARNFTLVTGATDCINTGAILADAYKMAFNPTTITYPFSTADQNLQGAAWEIGAYLVNEATYTTFYIAENGTASKGEARSCSNPMSVVEHNNNTFAPLDTIYVCNDGGTITSKIIPPSSGTVGEPITYIKAQPTLPVITVAADNGIEVNSKSYLVFDGLSVSGCGSSGMLFTTCDHITVQHSTIENNLAEGIWFHDIADDAEFGTITENTIGGNFNNGLYVDPLLAVTTSGGTVSKNVFNDNRYGGIWFTGVDNATIEDNEFLNHDGTESIDEDVIHLTAVSGTLHTGNSIKHNYLHGNHNLLDNSSAIESDLSNGLLIMYNIIDTDGGTGIMVKRNNTGTVRIYNNDIYNVGVNGIEVDYASGYTGTTDVKNNIIHTSGLYGFAVDADAASYVDIDYLFNYSYPTGAYCSWNGTVYADEAAFYSATSECPSSGAHCYESDPLFVDAASGIFRLQVSSPAIGVGYTLGALYDAAFDPGDTSFPYNTFDQDTFTPWEIGAFVYRVSIRNKRLLLKK